ncbi:MAG: M20/M25/M40 family metallo-hydrolase [Gemmatimonadetes bacterium]|nr:M20/M25/M40 family metallo-hydrolase [Gemmatimonadota bacterium]
MRRLFRPATLTALAALGGGWPAVTAAQGRPLTPTQQLAREVYQELIELNTSTNTSGTTIAAQAMARRFRAAGFAESDMFIGGVREDKHNLVVRYRGRGGPNAPKPVLLLAHLDVVEALKSDWSPDLDPFKLVERDGYFYGRGTTDDKAQGAIFVATVLKMKQDGYVPDRDIVLALTADEEGGCCNGARWLVQNHRSWVDASVVLNEGGFGYLKGDKPLSNTIEATQKVFGGFTITAKNPGGHSSLPRPDNAIYQLAAALMKLSTHKFPVELNDVTRAYLERTAPVETAEIGNAMRAILRNPADARAEAVLAKEPMYNSIMRTTCVATMLKGGHAQNALPQTAEVYVNCRMLPDARPADVRAALVKAIGDSSIEVSAAPTRDPRPVAPVTKDVMEAVEAVTKEMWGNIPVIPMMMTGATDAIPWRALGIPAYGVSGIMIDPNDLRAHGRDERLPVKSFYDGLEFTDRLVRRLTTPRVVP